MKTNIKIITDINTFSERVDEITAAVRYDDIKHTVAALKDALYEYKNVAALCAPQIGKNLRLFVVKTAKSEQNRFKVFLNPMIVSSKGIHLSRENSLSFPNKEFIIPRKNEIHVAYQAEDGQINSESYIGAYGEVVQQMIEMLDGITLFDYGLNLDDIGGPEQFDKASKKDKTDLLAIYLESLKNTAKELDEEIKNDDKLDTLNKTIDFMKGMLVGDITPIKKDGENK